VIASHGRAQFGGARIRQCGPHRSDLRFAGPPATLRKRRHYRRKESRACLRRWELGRSGIGRGANGTPRFPPDAPLKIEHRESLPRVTDRPVDQPFLKEAGAPALERGPGSPASGPKRIEAAGPAEDGSSVPASSYARPPALLRRKSRGPPR
jgi:hypothetical protein